MTKDIVRSIFAMVGCTKATVVVGRVITEKGRANHIHHMYSVFITSIHKVCGLTVSHDETDPSAKPAKPPITDLRGSECTQARVLFHNTGNAWNRGGGGCKEAQWRGTKGGRPWYLFNCSWVRYLIYVCSQGIYTYPKERKSPSRILMFSSPQYILRISMASTGTARRKLSRRLLNSTDCSRPTPKPTSPAIVAVPSTRTPLTPSTNYGSTRDRLSSPSISSTTMDAHSLFLDEAPDRSEGERQQG